MPQLLLRALGRRIRELRSEQGFSQEGFADKCGLHRTFMGIVERGESNLSFRNLAKVASNLAVPLSVLFQGIEEEAMRAASEASLGHSRHGGGPLTQYKGETKK